MEGVVGIFSSRATADSAVDDLLDAGLPSECIAYLTPEVTEAELARVPTTDAEGPGIGQAITTYLGGVIGASGGLALGTVIAGSLVSGVGPVLAAGVAAGTLIGAGGAAAGSAIGEEMERTLDTGIPRDDLPFYSALLKEGRSVVIALIQTSEMEDTARRIMRDHNSEDPAQARARLGRGQTEAA